MNQCTGMRQNDINLKWGTVTSRGSSGAMAKPGLCRASKTREIIRLADPRPLERLGQCAFICLEESISQRVREHSRARNSLITVPHRLGAAGSMAQIHRHGLQGKAHVKVDTSEPAQLPCSRPKTFYPQSPAGLLWPGCPEVKVSKGARAGVAHAVASMCTLQHSCHLKTHVRLAPVHTWPCPSLLEDGYLNTNIKTTGRSRRASSVTTREISTWNNQLH